MPGWSSKPSLTVRDHHFKVMILLNCLMHSLFDICIYILYIESIDGCRMYRSRRIMVSNWKIIDYQKPDGLKFHSKRMFHARASLYTSEAAIR